MAPATFEPVNLPVIVRLSSSGVSDGSDLKVALKALLRIFAFAPAARWAGRRR